MKKRISHSIFAIAYFCSTQMALSQTCEQKIQKQRHIDIVIVVIGALTILLLPAVPLGVRHINTVGKIEKLYEGDSYELTKLHNERKEYFPELSFSKEELKQLIQTANIYADAKIGEKFCVMPLESPIKAHRQAILKRFFPDGHIDATLENLQSLRTNT